MLNKYNINTWICSIEAEHYWDRDKCEEVHDWQGMLEAAKFAAFWRELGRRIVRVSDMITGMELIAIAGEVENKLHREDEDGMEVYAECYGMAIEYGLNDTDYAWEAPF